MALVQRTAHLDAISALVFPPHMAALTQPSWFDPRWREMRQFAEIESNDSDFTAFAAPSLAVFPTLRGI